MRNAVVPPFDDCSTPCNVSSGSVATQSLQKAKPVNIRNELLTIGILLAAMTLPCLADQASWYGEEHRGQLMANGHRFDPDKLTAASWFYDLGTKLVVTHGDRSVVVEVTDRGPARHLVQKGRVIDLSRAAFAILDSPSLGLIDVTIQRQSAAQP